MFGPLNRMVQKERTMRHTNDRSQYNKTHLESLNENTKKEKNFGAKPIFGFKWVVGSNYLISKDVQTRNRRNSIDWYNNSKKTNTNHLTQASSVPYDFFFNLELTFVFCDNKSIYFNSLMLFFLTE